MKIGFSNLLTPRVEIYLAGHNSTVRYLIWTYWQKNGIREIKQTAWLLFAIIVHSLWYSYTKYNKAKFKYQRFWLRKQSDKTD